MSSPPPDQKMSEFPLAGPINFITDYVPILRLVAGVPENLLALAADLDVDAGEAAGGGGGAVNSVFGRVGNVLAVAGDYNWFQISGAILPPVSGENLTNLNAGALTFGTVPAGRLPVIPVTGGGTGLTTNANGDLLLGTGGTALARLPDVATGNALISGGVGAPPSWGKINLATHVVGVLPPANGGTGGGSFTLNAVLIGGGVNPITTVGPGAARTLLAANGAAPFFTTTPTIEGVTITDGTNSAKVFPTYFRFNDNVGLERSAAGVLKVTDEADALKRGHLWARRLELSNDPAYTPGTGAPGAYLHNIRSSMLVSGDPNTFDKWQNFTSWTNIKGLTAHHAGSQDFYGLTAEIGTDPTNTFHLFTIYGVHGVAFTKGAGNIDDGLIGAMGRSAAGGSGVIQKHRGAQGWAITIAGATGSSTTAQGVYGLISNDAAGYTITTAAAGDFWISSNSGTIGNAYVIRAQAATGGAGTVTGNRYGLYIADQAVGTVTGTVYNLYSAGARLNVLEGSLGVGTDTPAAQLDVLNAAGNQLRLTNQEGATPIYSELGTGAGGILTISATKGSINFSTLGKQIDPALGYQENLGSLQKKYLSLHAAELWVETLVAQDTIATIGGRILVGPTTVLTADLAPASTSISVKHNEMSSIAPGDVVVMQAAGKLEFMLVTGGPTGSGPFVYTVTRNLDGTGANQWYAGDAVFNTGRAGEGFIDLYSISAITKTPGQAIVPIGPSIVGNVRNSVTYNDWSEHWAIGNLSGVYGYGATTYGVGLGKYAAAAAHVTLDATFGLRMFAGLNTVVGRWYNDGSIAVGQEVIGQSNIFLSAGGAVPAGTMQFRYGPSIVRQQFNPDGSGFLANSNIAWDTAGNTTIAGWLVTSAALVKDTGSNASSSGLAPGDFPFFAGATYANRATAPFRVTPAGLLNATGATISGAITATTGSIAGWAITSTGFSKDEVKLAAGADPASIAGTGEAWFGKSTFGSYGLALKGTTAAQILLQAGHPSFGSSGRPFLAMRSESAWRVVIGELDTTAWGGSSTPSMGMKIWDSAGTLIVRFADGSLPAGGNMISGWEITASKISSTGVELRSGASAGLAFGTTPSAITASAGTGIFLDQTGLYGLNASGSPAGVQVKLDAATGTLIAGAGKVTVDAKGIRITEGNATEGSFLKWMSSTTSIFEFVGYRATSPNSSFGQIVARALAADTTGYGQLWFESQNAAGAGSFIKIQTMSTSHATAPNKGLIVLQPYNSGMTYIGWGGNSFPPTASVALKVADGALMFQPMDSTAEGALTPSEGMVIYNVTTHKLRVRTNTAWVDLH